MNFLKKYLPILLVVLLQIPLIAPFFHSGFFPTHDDVQVVRIFEMFQSLKYGGFPSHWSSGLLYGHGYPLYTFYSPFIYYLGSIFPFLGLNFLLSAKLVFLIAFLIGGLGFFFLCRYLFGTIPAILGSVAYSYAPYRAVDVYVRGSLAEFFAFQLFPWIFLFNLKLINEKKQPLNQYFFALLLAVLLLTHNISAFIFGGFLLSFNLLYLLKTRKWNFTPKLISSVLISLGLSSFFILPLLLETKFVRLSKFSHFPYQKYFVTLQQLWDTPWGFGGFIEPKPMSLQIGKLILVLSAFTILANLFKRSKHFLLMIFLSLVSLFLIFLETRDSLFIWDKLTILHYFQFPWRLHILLTTTLSLLVALGIYTINRLMPKFLTALLVLAFSFLIVKENISYFKPQKYTNSPAVAETTTWDDEYMPIWVKVKPTDYSSDKFKFSSKADFSNIVWGYYTKKVELDAPEGGVLTVSHVYYPGWKSYVDGKEVKISYQNINGFMEIPISSGKHKVDLKFSTTWWRLISELISVFTLGFLLTKIFLVLKPRPLGRKHVS